MINMPENLSQLIDQKTFAHLATVMSDGSPHVAPVWIDHKDGHILITSGKGTVKDLNMRRNPNVAISMVEPENPYKFVSVKGTVIEVTEQGGDDLVDALAFKYLNEEKYPYRQEGDVYVIYKIEVEKFTGN